MNLIRTFLFGCFLVAAGPFIASSLAAQDLDGGDIRLASYNIWYDNPANSSNLWSDRKGGIRDFLLSQNIDIACLQEALRHQVEYLKQEGYAHVGVGRDDGKEGGEFTVILYNPAKFTVLADGNFWLSDTPELPGSVGWDAALTRMATWVNLRDVKTGKEFYVFNTHFDHVGELARLNSARLLKNKIREIAGDNPVILAGDFNFKADTQPYQVITAVSEKPVLKDSRTLSELPESDPGYSFMGSDFDGIPGDIIDYIFLTESISIIDTRIVDNCVQNRCPSDHLPVYLAFRILGK